MNFIVFDRMALDAATKSAAENAVAEIVFDLLPADARAQLDIVDAFGESVTKTDIVRSAVQAAQRENQAYKFGTTAKKLFAYQIPDEPASS